MAVSEVRSGRADTDDDSRSSSYTEGSPADVLTHTRCCGDANIGDYLRGAPAVSILEPHATILTINSNVPFLVCLKAMSEYGQEFALVYDSAAYDFIGYLDEETVIWMLAEEKLEVVNFSCKEVLEMTSRPSFCKVPESFSALDVLRSLLNQSSERLLVWSAEKDVAIGVVTPTSYLRYLTQCVCFCHGALEHNFEAITSSPQPPVVEETCEQKELLTILRNHRRAKITSSDGQMAGIISRTSAVKYILSLLKSKEHVILTAPVSNMLNHYKDTPDSWPLLIEVKPSQILKDHSSQLFHTSSDAVLCSDNAAGSSRVITVSDVLRHVTRHFI